MSMAGKRSTTGALRQPPGGGFVGTEGDRARRILCVPRRRVEQLLQPVTLAGELGPGGVPDRRAVAQGDAARVLGHPVHPELVVQVRAAREPGRSDVSDGLTLADTGTGPNAARERPKVPVAGGDAIPVAELDQISIPAGAPGPEHYAIAGGHHRRPGRSRVVRALVPAGDPEHRVETRPCERR